MQCTTGWTIIGLDGMKIEADCLRNRKIEMKSLEPFESQAVIEEPLVSVVIPSRNRLELLRRAVASIDAQKYSNIEIVIVDNNSDVPIEANHFESRCNITVLRMQSMRLASHNRNAGANLASGEYICFLDDDDTYVPEKISDQIAFLGENPEYDFCYADVLHLDQGGNPIGKSSGEPDLITFLRWRHIHPNSLMVRKGVMSSHRFDESMTTFEDVEFAGQLLLNCKGHHISAIHSYWNRDNRPDQLTGRNFYRSYFNWKKLCATFSSIIESERGLAQYYHRKMLLLSIRFLDVGQLFHSLSVLIRSPSLPRNK